MSLTTERYDRASHDEHRTLDRATRELDGAARGRRRRIYDGHERIVHSGSFRRLQGKTQILSLGESEFYRTRLTHTLEVAQIASSLSHQLSKDEAQHPGAAHLPPASLIQAVALTHDLGHPPFGHGGEVALNYCMRENGGFEGNGQACGANLTRRTMLGALKYPAPFSAVVNADVSPTLRSDTTTLV